MGTPNRIASLDGMRAVAIFFVIAEHAAQRGADWLPAHASRYLLVLAYDGVRIFFVLSGFLITSILLREFSNSGTISLRKFYWRRSLRIFPAMYALLAAVGVAYSFGIIHIGTENPLRFFSAAFYISDYLPVNGWPLHHTWSLSVEEQFYLLWPAFLLICGIRRAALFPGLLILVALVSRALAFDEYRFDSVADSLAVGCLIAIYRPQLENLLSRWWPKSVPLSALLVLPVVAVPLSNPFSWHVFHGLVGIPLFYVGIPLFNIAVGIAMLGAILDPPAWLNAAPMVWLGQISYSLYLWHLPWVMDGRIGWLWLPAAVICAWLSYRFIEQPILRLRDRGAPLPDLIAEST